MTRTEEIVEAKLNLNYWLAVRNGYEPNDMRLPRCSMSDIIEELQEKVDMLESVEELINTALT